MFNLPELRIDRLSFWLGFLTASLLWWLLSRIRPLLPVWREQFRQYLNTIYQKNLASAEEYLRNNIIRQAQRQHHAARLFSLDEILIPPYLLAPPSEQDPGTQLQNQSVADQVVPYLPDSPEIIASLGVNRLTPIQAVQNSQNIAIIGQPGTGKTVLLCHLACQIARREIESGNLADSIPLLIHILDLDVTLNEEQDPFDNIIQSLTSRANLISQRQLPRYLKAVLRDKQRRLVLLIDGLDEVPPERLFESAAFLGALHRKHPRLHMIVTASADYAAGLYQAGFYPLAISAWSQTERREFCHKWGQVWHSLVSPELQKASVFTGIDPIFYDHWLGAESDYATPLEWTLRLWGAYAGDLSGSSPVNIFTAYLTRFLPGTGYISVLAELAHAMVTQSCASLAFNEMEKILSKARPEQVEVHLVEAAAGQAVDENISPGGAKKGTRRNRRDLVASQGEQIIDGLLNGGVLIEHSNGQIRFSSPVMIGFLAGMKITADEAATLRGQLNWTAAAQTLHYAAAFSEDVSWIYPLIENSSAPLYRNLLIAARWLRDAPVQAVWRSNLMRTLVSLIQVDILPLSIRARLLNIFYVSRDPSFPLLIKQLLVARSPVLRRAALLGCAAAGEQQFIDKVLELLADRDPHVRYTACLALAAIPGEASLNALVEVLLSGDEELRQAAAEALAQKGADGRNLLEEAAGVEDLLVRRAAVFGLLQVGDTWARKLLEKVAVEDGQWVVRNAAAQALDTLLQSNPGAPLPLPPPSESSWLLNFASKYGQGIPPGQPATEVLLMALKSGSADEQIAALNYLRNEPEEGVIKTVYDLLYGVEESVREPAVQALWWMASSGVELPDPIKFGLG